MRKLIIAIDGPAGAGKSTTARRVAERLGYLYVDTGAMYRAVTFAVLRAGISLCEEAVARILPQLQIGLRSTPGGQRTLLNGEDITEQLRLPEVTRWVSLVSSYPSVRRFLVEQQRRLGQGGGVVMDGRDIGTVVFPDADVKVFLTASLPVRARRRLRELQERGILATEEEVASDLQRRDLLDSRRTESPLSCAPDAVVVDTTELTIEEQTESVLELVRQKLCNKSG
ncbi:MAG: (d)CMP kinase [Candidatus Kapabacteria bacterium]|nr:(d)CMP kinase [Candidatus Kapabacteria bacterium]MCS7170086.1 (d)CMP kinase [Candidatus Kapabacteria bacterium]MDW7997159.1 (d)CMP kinase [Bacteroidota bacterium]MDW8225471.1 (d)CMP kinase [Bacteroidota bacterium]